MTREELIELLTTSEQEFLKPALKRNSDVLERANVTVSERPRRVILKFVSPSSEHCPFEVIFHRDSDGDRITFFIAEDGNILYYDRCTKEEDRIAYIELVTTFLECRVRRDMWFRGDEIFREELRFEGPDVWLHEVVRFSKMRWWSQHYTSRKCVFYEPWIQK